MGLIDGASGWRPNRTPATYPPTSLETASRMNRRTWILPLTGFASIIITKPAMNGRYAVANVPAAASRTAAVPEPSMTRQTTTPATVRTNETIRASGPE